MKKKSIPFVKMVGAGNDFVVIDAQPGLHYKKLTLAACDRTNGIGADGLLILDKSKKADYKMRIINADGSEAEMCGNGGRCMAVYIQDRHKPKKKLFSIETLAGSILGQANGETAKIRLSDPKDLRTDIKITFNDRPLTVHYIDTGVPHTIIFVDGLDKIDVAGIGPSIRNHKAFAPRGANVNFVEQVGPDLVHARTFERGVEGETKACGTGSVASAIVAYIKAHPASSGKREPRMKVKTASGEILDVRFQQNGDKISGVWLKGSARFIAQGEFFL